MSSKFIPLAPGIYDVEIQSHGGNCLYTTVREGLMLQSIEPVYHGGSKSRYKMKFTKAERFAQRAQPIDPLDCMVRVKDQPLVDLHQPYLRDLGDMPVRRLAHKIAEEISIVPAGRPFTAEDGRSYVVLTIAKVTEERAIPRVLRVPQGDVETKLYLPVSTTRRFYFRSLWCADPDSWEASFQCSSYEALLGEDLSVAERAETGGHKVVVRMVLPKSTGSPLGAVLAEYTKK